MLLYCIVIPPCSAGSESRERAPRIPFCDRRLSRKAYGFRSAGNIAELASAGFRSLGVCLNMLLICLHQSGITGDKHLIGPGPGSPYQAAFTFDCLKGFIMTISAVILQKPGNYRTSADEVKGRTKGTGDRREPQIAQMTSHEVRILITDY